MEVMTLKERRQLIWVTALHDAGVTFCLVRRVLKAPCCSNPK